MKRKENIKKIILISICVIIILFIFVRNVIGGVGTNRGESDRGDHAAVEGITRQEAYRLFSYVIYDRAGRDGLEVIFTDSDDLNNPYVSYVNALIVADILDWNDTNSLSTNIAEELSCGEFRDLLLKIAKDKKIDYKKLVETIPERLKTVKKEDTLSLSEFLSVYETLVKMVEDEALRQGLAVLTTKQSLFFIGSQGVKENTKNNRMIDQSGSMYYYNNYKDYSSLLLESLDETKQNYIENETSIDTYIDVPIEAMVCGDELVYIRSILTSEVTLSNVWIMEGEATTIKMYVAGIERQYETVLPLSNSISQKIGDVTIENGIITAVTVKPDTISGKVLLTTKNEIEIEGYGTLPFDPNFKIYKIYGNISMEQTNRILVGYTITDFVVSDGVICAALIKESIKAKNIRVLINTSGYKSVHHSSVKLTSNKPFIIAYGEQQDLYEAGVEVTVTPEDKMVEAGRIKITSTSEDGKITLLSVDRSYGKPEYRGSIEIKKSDKGLTVVNEVTLEEYLYSVVPSEMPTSYGLEALKVQAVCARSFAYNQLLENVYSAYGAHVDDSVNSQVYNNIRESDATILAVKETYGQVLKRDNKVLTAYYFSTSSGHTANIEDVWGGNSVPYLTGYLQTEEKQEVDLSKEDNFRDFIKNGMVPRSLAGGVLTQSVETYDSGFLMYRWRVSISVEDLSKQINEKLSSCYNSNKNSILTLVSKKNEEGLENGVGIRILDGAVYKSTPISDIGKVTSMKVITRGSSGIIKELLISGTKNTVLVYYQTNVRNLLAPVYDDLYRLDDSVMSGMTMLPSAFFYIDKKSEQGSATEFLLTGGGYGHGVGMSQNGVKTMTSQGKTYDEVLKHFYSGVDLGFVYE